MALKDLVVHGPMPPRPIPKPRRIRKRYHKNKPQTIDDDTWFYETDKGLEVVHEIRADGGSYIRTDQFIIPWKKVMSAAHGHEPWPLFTPKGQPIAFDKNGKPRPYIYRGKRRDRL